MLSLVFLQSYSASEHASITSGSVKIEQDIGGNLYERDYEKQYDVIVKNTQLWIIFQ